MTDKNHIYVNTSNGHWYYWNGSAWTDGGVYLADEDKNPYSVLEDNKYNVLYSNIYPICNLVNPAEAIVGKRYSSWNKTKKSPWVADYAPTIILKPFPVIKGMSYFITRGYWVDPWSFVCDNEGNFLGNITRSTTNFNEWTCPYDGWAWVTVEAAEDSYSDLMIYPTKYRKQIGRSPYLEANKPIDFLILQNDSWISLKDKWNSLSSSGNSNIIYNNITVGIDKDFTTIKAAINSITDSSKAKRYNILIDEGTYQESSLTLPDYVNLVGASKDRSKTIIEGYLPATSTAESIANTSTININKNHELRNLTIIAQNERYPIHSESQGNFPDWTIIVDNCYIEHKGNQEAKDYIKSQGGDPKTIWSVYHAWGEGSSDNAYLKITNSVLKTIKGHNAFYAHGATTIANPYTHILENCYLYGNIYIDDTTPTCDNNTLIIKDCFLSENINIVGSNNFNCMVSGSGIHPIYQSPERLHTDLDFPIFTDYVKYYTCNENINKGTFVYSIDGKTINKANSSTPKQLIVGYIIGNHNENDSARVMTGYLQSYTQTWPESDTMVVGKYYKLDNNGKLLTETTNIEEAIGISGTRYYTLFI